MSDYIIYTTDNGVLNFTNDLRIFIGRYDDINYWNNCDIYNIFYK